MRSRLRRLTLREVLDVILIVLLLVPYVRPLVGQAQGIHHLKVCTASSDGDPAKVQCTDWNTELVVQTLYFGSGALVDPPSPRDGELWPFATGVSPARTIGIKMRDLGVTRTVTSITF
jgi:hypothetical protein